MQLEGKLTSHAKPKQAWGNHKRATSYTWVGRGLVLKNRAILDGRTGPRIDRVGSTQGGSTLISP
jgi:hypothetical protein